MKKLLLTKWMLLLCALVAGGNLTASAQGDKSAVYTSNVTLSTTGGASASACNVVINSTSYNGIKCGTSNKAGAMTITVPSGTKYLHIHVAGWNGETVTLSVTPNTNVTPTSITLTANSGIQSNSPFTFSGDPSSSSYYKVLTFTTPLSEATSFTFFCH